MEITRDMMPENTRYCIENTGATFLTADRGWKKFENLTEREFESAVAIAYMHFDQLAEHMSEACRPEINRLYQIRDKWLSLLKPPLVFGKDFTGWERTEGTVTTFVAQELNPRQGEVEREKDWKRVLRTSKVIE